MKILGKNAVDYIDAIKIPLLIRIALALVMACWVTLTVFIGGTNTTEIVSILLWILTIGVGIILAAYSGFNMARKKGTLANCALTGLLFGLVSGAVAWTLDMFPNILGMIQTSDVSGYMFWMMLNMVLSIAASLGDAILALIGGVIGGALKNK
ncbi:MAG: hypothetical protein FJY77_02775 [Candidatus Altiarchaeales archaeon]|nr:hypothetical protein [Candidatus Altiarchaeales archaeon]